MTNYILGLLSLYAVVASLAAVVFWRGTWSACAEVMRAGGYAQVCEVIGYLDGEGL